MWDFFFKFLRPFQKIWTLIFWYAPTLRLLYILSSLIDVWLRSRFSHTPIYIIIIGHIDTPMICRRFLYNHMHVFFLQGGIFFYPAMFCSWLSNEKNWGRSKTLQDNFLGWTIWSFGEDMYVYDCFLIHFFFLIIFFFCFMVLSLLLTIFSSLSCCFCGWH